MSELASNSIVDAAPSSERFALGHIVIPAQDGMLADLGFDVQTLGDRALGVVTEARKGKSLVAFPELKLTLWVAHTEMADLELDYPQLVPDFSPANADDLNVVWWVWKLARDLNAKFVLGLEKGLLREVWDEREDLSVYYKGTLDTAITYLGLGVGELVLEKWERSRQQLGSRLLFARFLPAGMHKIELALYLRE